MQINVEIENSEEEWSYDSDVVPRKGEYLTYGWEERSFIVTLVSHRIHQYHDGNMRLGAMDITVAEI